MEGKTNTPEDLRSQESLIGENWPSLPIPAESQDKTNETQDSPIPPAQKSPTAWRGQQRGPDDYEKDRVGRYAKYFKGNEILPIPEIAEKISPRVLSLVVRHKNQKAGGAEQRYVRGAVEEGRHPMPILLQKKFCHMGCPAS